MVFLYYLIFQIEQILFRSAAIMKKIGGTSILRLSKYEAFYYDEAITEVSTTALKLLDKPKHIFQNTQK